MTNLDPNWRTQRVKPTVLDYRHVDYYGDAAPTNTPHADRQPRHQVGAPLLVAQVRGWL